MTCIRYDFYPIGGMVAPYSLSVNICIDLRINIQIVRPPQREHWNLELFQILGCIFVKISSHKSPPLRAHIAQKGC